LGGKVSTETLDVRIRLNYFYAMELKSILLLGDCAEQLKKIEDNSVDLIFTSPPYADQRKNTYGGIHPDEYVQWFLPIANELLRVLKPTGTFVLNIKEKVMNGERHTYVMELILEMRKQGWLWTEEFIWHKKNCYPGKWPNRFRDAWERLLQFNKNKQFNMYQDAVMVPMGDWAKSRLKNLSETDKKRDDSKVGSGFGKNISNWLSRDKAYPTNVLHLATECSNKNHSAAFPEGLPEWFIKLFTQPGDVVLDPFMGSGTTIIIAERMYRNAIGIEILPEYFESVKAQSKTAQWVLFEEAASYTENQ
jgi:site-specific DNA-methyltransferase (adenine-specific)/site-specific DNA-methyltransferase (cytosine-N4-specific)